jgi:hypothetical protein
MGGRIHAAERRWAARQPAAVEPPLGTGGTRSHPRTERRDPSGSVAGPRTRSTAGVPGHVTVARPRRVGGTARCPERAPGWWSRRFERLAEPTSGQWPTTTRCPGPPPGRGPSPGRGPPPGRGPSPWRGPSPGRGQRLVGGPTRHGWDGPAAPTRPALRARPARRSARRVGVDRPASRTAIPRCRPADAAEGAAARALVRSTHRNRRGSPASAARLGWQRNRVPSARPARARRRR